MDETSYDTGAANAGRVRSVVPTILHAHSTHSELFVRVSDPRFPTALQRLQCTVRVFCVLMFKGDWGLFFSGPGLQFASFLALQIASSAIRLARIKSLSYDCDGMSCLKPSRYLRLGGGGQPLFNGWAPLGKALFS